MFSTRRQYLLAVTMAACALSAGPTLAQGPYLAKLISTIVAYPPGAEATSVV